MPRRLGTMALAWGLCACATPLPEPQLPPIERPAAQGAAPTPPPAPPPIAAGKPAGYAGLGVASLTPEQLEKFRPRPISSDVSRRIQALMDVRAPGIGRLTPDGKTLFFSWSITGVP